MPQPVARVARGAVLRPRDLVECDCLVDLRGEPNLDPGVGGLDPVGRAVIQRDPLRRNAVGVEARDQARATAGNRKPDEAVAKDVDAFAGELDKQTASIAAQKEKSKVVEAQKLKRDKHFRKCFSLALIRIHSILMAPL